MERGVIIEATGTLLAAAAVMWLATAQGEIDVPSGTVVYSDLELKKQCDTTSATVNEEPTGNDPIRFRTSTLPLRQRGASCPGTVYINLGGN
ncbi:MAG: hypothetical protein AAB834_00500 [Patescibacteria group bacterium]